MIEIKDFEVYSTENKLVRDKESGTVFVRRMTDTLDTDKYEEVDVPGFLKAYKKAYVASRYGERTEKYISLRYSVCNELAILRQRDTKPAEFEEYNTYAEECKATAIKELEEEFDRMTAILRKTNNTK